MDKDNNLKEDNLEDGAIDLWRLEAELLVDWTHDVDRAVEMPPPSTAIVDTSRISVVAALASQPPSLHGGHVACGGALPIVPQSIPPTPIVISREKKLEVAHGKQKTY
jgi:hypothetical protein